jgi:hypothetical protein
MWDEIVKHLVDFSSAVLTGVDEAGYPFSIRCKPEPDVAEQVLHVQVPEYTNIQPGSAGLLCHKHDEQLWNLKNFMLRGSLESSVHGWIFRPQRFIPGAGIGGLLGMVRFLRSGRRIAKRYLDKRGLEHPVIPWDRVHALWAEVKKSK